MDLDLLLLVVERRPPPPGSLILMPTEKVPSRAGCLVHHHSTLAEAKDDSPSRWMVGWQCCWKVLVASRILRRQPRELILYLFIT